MTNPATGRRRSRATPARPAAPIAILRRAPLQAPPLGRKPAFTPPTELLGLP